MSDSNGYTEIIKDSFGNDVVHHSFLPRNATVADRKAYVQRMRAMWTAERLAQAKPVPIPGQDAAQPQDVSAPDDPDGNDFTTNVVPNATLAPFSSVGRLTGTLNGFDYFASAFCVGPQMMMTAAHAVYPVSQTAFLQNVTFSPQYANGQPGAPGQFFGTDVYVYTKWVSSHGLLPAWDVDYAFVVMNEEMTNVPALGIDFSHPGTAARPMVAAGYPTDPFNATYPYDGKSMWQDVTSARKKWLTWYESLIIPMPISHGWSGGPWIDSSTQQVFGLSSYFKPLVNYKMFSPTFGPRAQALYNLTQNTAPVWTMPLTIGYGETNALVVGDSAYVSCPTDGRIYQLNVANGTLQNMQPLTGYENDAVTLASDGTNLYAGIHGYLVNIPLTNFTVPKPVYSGLPGSGFNGVSVLCDNGNVFAASNGYAYMVTDKTSMTVQATSWNGFGSGPMAITSDGTSLYAASNSVVAQFPLANFTGNPTWFVNVTKIGGMAGHMRAVMVGTMVCVTTNGALFVLDSATGKQLSYWPLSNFEVVPIATDRYESVYLFKVTGIGSAVLVYSVTAINLVTGEIAWTTQIDVPETLVDTATIHYVREMVIVGFNGTVTVLTAETGAIVATAAFAATDSAGGTFIAPAEDGSFVAGGINGTAYGWTLAISSGAVTALGAESTEQGKEEAVLA